MMMTTVVRRSAQLLVVLGAAAWSGCGSSTESGPDEPLIPDAGTDDPRPTTPASTSATPTCGDGTKNADESDVDCGGSCTKCDNGRNCTAPADCASGVCASGKCLPTGCTNGVKDGSETDVDCGGEDCAQCDAGKACEIPADCTSTVCTGFVCQAPSCTDAVKNGTETDIDCGSTCTTKCALFKSCVASADCASEVCTKGKCDYSIVAASAGNQHTCALRASGVLKCWGRGALGQLGLEDANNRGTGPNEMGSKLPVVDVGTGRTVSVVSNGGSHTCAILDDTSLKCWGSNATGQLGLGDTNNRGDNAGEMGNNLPAVSLGTGRTAKTIVAGEQHTCAILDDGSLKCWGLNNTGQLGLGDANTRGDGPNEMGNNLLAVSLGTGRKATDVAIGHDSTCAVLDNGTVKCWGGNTYGQLGRGDTNPRGNTANQMGDALAPVPLGTGRTAKAIAAGYVHFCALLNDGTVKCWGFNNNGQLGQGDTNNRGDNAGEMGDSLPAIALGTGRVAKSISCGGAESCALLDDETIKCWGQGVNGFLGTGDTTNRGDGPGEMGDALPSVVLGAGRRVRFLVGGWNDNCAILDNDTLKCWGANNYGQLGLGDTNNRGDAPGEMSDALPTVSF